MFGLGLSIKELMERGVKLGADIPYCLMRGTALSEGIGEELTPLPQDSTMSGADRKAGDQRFYKSGL